jgi:hypothetical protein
VVSYRQVITFRLFSNTNILKRIIKQRGNGSAGKNEKWSSGETEYWNPGNRVQKTASGYKTSSCIMYPVSCISLLRVLRVPSFVTFVVKNEDLGIGEHDRGINILF